MRYLENKEGQPMNKRQTLEQIKQYRQITLKTIIK